MRTSRQFGGSILKGGRQKFRSDCGCGGRTSIMFTQTGGRRNWGGHRSTPGRNLPQINPVPGRDGQLYRYNKCFACHRYGIFADKFPDKKTKAINIAMIGVIMMKNGCTIKKT